jgi:hypothetical protein
MKKSIVLLFFFFISVAAKAQQKETASVDQSMAALSLIFPSISYEQKINTNHTWLVGAEIRGYASNAGLFTGVFGDYRKYYNLQKRQDQKKNTDGNSGNFLAARLSVLNYIKTNSSDNNLLIPNNSNKVYFAIGPVWGLQRTYKSRINLGLSVGPALITDGSNTGLDVQASFRLGFYLFGKK